MPRKPRRPCRHPGCPNLCEDGEQYCEKHRKEADKYYDFAYRLIDGNNE